MQYKESEKLELKSSFSEWKEVVISLSALREAIVNALIHRDYTDPGNIQIRIFDSRLEVWSPGLLPKELDLKKILSENRSIPRNKVLVDIFHKLGLIEGWGTGFQRMLSKCLKNNNKEPDFSEKAGAFVIKFYKRKKIEGVIEGVNVGVNVGVNLLFDYIKDNPGKRVINFEKNFGVTNRTIERWLKKLKDDDKIEFKGSSKTGGYFVKK